MKRFIVMWSVMVVLLFSSLSGYSQCAMCKASVEKSETEKASFEQRAKGLNTGILYLMSVPYILAGIIGYYWYRNSRRERERKNEIQRIIKSKMSSMQGGQDF